MTLISRPYSVTVLLALIVLLGMTACGPGAHPARRVGEMFQDCGTCPHMVVVPAGSFIMGSPSQEEGRFENEGP